MTEWKAFSRTYGSSAPPQPAARVTHQQEYYSVHTGKIGGTGRRFLSSIARARCVFERKGEELTSESRAAFNKCPSPRRPMAKICEISISKTAQATSEAKITAKP